MLVRFVVGVALLIIGVPLCFAVLRMTVLAHRDLPEDPLALLGGALAGLALVFLKRPNWFIHTALHEACHLIACWVLLVPVSSLKVTDGAGGEVVHGATGPVRTTLIAMAPYVMPLVLAPVLIAQWFTPEGPARSMLTFLAGFAYVLHLTGLLHNIRLNLLGAAGDFARAGRVLGVALVACSVLLITAASVAVLWDSRPWPGDVR